MVEKCVPCRGALWHGSWRAEGTFNRDVTTLQNWLMWARSEDQSLMQLWKLSGVQTKVLTENSKCMQVLVFVELRGSFPCPWECVPLAASLMLTPGLVCTLPWLIVMDTHQPSRGFEDVGLRGSPPLLLSFGVSLHKKPRPALNIP